MATLQQGTKRQALTTAGTRLPAAQCIRVPFTFGAPKAASAISPGRQSGPHGDLAHPELPSADPRSRHRNVPHGYSAQPPEIEPA